MDFTFAEIDVLIAKGMLPKDKINTFGILRWKVGRRR